MGQKHVFQVRFFTPSLPFSHSLHNLSFHSIHFVFSPMHSAMQCLSLSLSLTASSDGQQLSICSQSRMVLVMPPGAGDCDDPNVAASSESVFQPPTKNIRMEKKEKVDEGGREEMEEVNELAVNSTSPLEALGEALLASQAMACVVVSAPLPSFSSSSVDAAVIASWCERGGGGGGGGGGD